MGLPWALSLMSTAPVRGPEAVGVNVTFVVQAAPGASDPATGVGLWCVISSIVRILESREQSPGTDIRQNN